MNDDAPSKPSQEADQDPLASLPYALGKPTAEARFRIRDDDFQVEELIEIPEHESGAHWWMQIRKTGLNTRDAVRALARLGSARVRQLGYAGLKDRHAVTTQWISLPIETLDPASVVDRMPEGLELLSWKRARHAIRRGGLQANRFAIRLRDVQGDRAALDTRLAALSQGVPNYFGAQRFGHGGNNLRRARQLFVEGPASVPRFERGLYLSAARAWLFNLVLAERIRQGSWRELIEGEAVVLDGSRSWFPLTEPPTALQARLDRFDIHPSGPLVGESDRGPGGACLALEQAVLAEEAGLVEGLCALRMRAERRALRLPPRHFTHAWSGDDLRLRFDLPSGTFATSVLRELVRLQEPTPADRVHSTDG